MLTCHSGRPVWLGGGLERATERAINRVLADFAARFSFEPPLARWSDAVKLAGSPAEAEGRDQDGDFFQMIVRIRRLRLTGVWTDRYLSNAGSEWARN
jgi:hypothetical protein